MSIKRKDIISMSLDLAKKCKKNNIWFALDNNTMLGAIRHGGFVPWFEKFEVMTNVEGYNKLMNLFPNNLVDSFKNKNYKSLACSWVKNSNDWKKEQPFVKIRIVIDTTIKKIISFSKFSKRLKKFFNRQNYNDIRLTINDLYEPKLFQGHLLIDNSNNDLRKKQYLSKRWIQVLSYKTIDVEFSGHKFPVIKEYKSVLERWFGKEYMKAKVPNAWYEYPAPLMNVRVK